MSHVYDDTCRARLGQLPYEFIWFGGPGPRFHLNSYGFVALDPAYAVIQMWLCRTIMYVCVSTPDVPDVLSPKLDAPAPSPDVPSPKPDVPALNPDVLASNSDAPV